jgi:cysteinyl-tRNA synthetase
VNINKEKMSKSLGNVFMIKELLKRYHPEVVRMFLFSVHYRSPVDFSEQNLAEAEMNLERFYETLAKIKELSASAKEKTDPPKGHPLEEVIAGLDKEFMEAMDDDFNTALALANFHEALRAVNQRLNDPTYHDKQGDIKLYEKAAIEFARLGKVLGIFQEDPLSYLKRKKEFALAGLEISTEEIEGMIKERDEARKNKDFKKADSLRAQLSEKGIILEDTAKGTIWKVKK